MATSNKLTDAICRSVKPTTAALKLFDGGGLYLWVSPTGAKTWRLSYRQDGKPNTISFGPYPAVSLADARAQREETKARMRQGIYPSREAAPRATHTLAQTCDEFWTQRQDISESYRDNALRGLALHLYPALGARPIAGITKDDLMAELARMDAEGKLVYLRRIRLWVSQALDWAEARGYIDHNPAKLINTTRAFRRNPVQHFAALELSEVPELMQKLRLENELQSALACRLLALTWTRTSELRLMTWSEVDGDTWRIPGKRMKRRNDHLVPLSAQALSILDAMKRRSRGSDYVFPSEHRIDRPLSENAILYLLYRLGYRGKMTGHGWRSIGSTWANERGYNPDAIERQLAHQPGKSVRAVYNRAEYLPERRSILQDWGNWLDECVNRPA